MFSKSFTGVLKKLMRKYDTKNNFPIRRKKSKKFKKPNTTTRIKSNFIWDSFCERFPDSKKKAIKQKMF